VQDETEVKFYFHHNEYVNLCAVLGEEASGKLISPVFPRRSDRRGSCQSLRIIEEVSHSEKMRQQQQHSRRASTSHRVAICESLVEQKENDHGNDDGNNDENDIDQKEQFGCGIRTLALLSTELSNVCTPFGCNVTGAKLILGGSRNIIVEFTN